MSRSLLPREPIVLTFDPESPGTDSNVAKVFRDYEARACWLIIKPGHLAGPHFNEQCLRAAEAIRAKKPKSPEKLYEVIKHKFDWAMFDSQSYEAHRPLFERLHAAVSGKRPLRYVIALPGSSEERKVHLQERRRGFWDGLYGRGQRGYGVEYSRAFLKGAQLRCRIQETQDSIRYA